MTILMLIHSSTCWNYMRYDFHSFLFCIQVAFFLLLNIKAEKIDYMYAEISLYDFAVICYTPVFFCQASTYFPSFATPQFSLFLQQQEAGVDVPLKVNREILRSLEKSEVCVLLLAMRLLFLSLSFLFLLFLFLFLLFLFFFFKYHLCLQIFIVPGSSPFVPTRYYRTMAPSLPVVLCATCNHFFLEDDFEVAAIHKNVCPMCRAPARDTLAAANLLF